MCFLSPLLASLRTPVTRSSLLRALSVIVLLACPGRLPAWETPRQPPEAVRGLLKNHCLDCHDSESKQGGFNLERLLTSKSGEQQQATWVKVESMIARGKMPPQDADPLPPAHRKQFLEWFERQFVRPGGVQHAGVSQPRRLTREELQNTLEDILHVDLRVTVTNSRLHVIPDSVLEKFFTPGVVGPSGFSNDAATLSQETVDIQTYARCFARVLSKLERNPRARTRLWGRAELARKMPPAEVRQLLRRVGRKAFRRPLTAAELEAFATVYNKMSRSREPAEAFQSAMLAMLLSPPFLYRFEERVQGQAPVTPTELAVRLSYFLWSAPPDSILEDLAASGKLSEPDVLRAQVRRMLRDPKRIALAENLGGEWFDYKKLRQQSAVNKRSDKMAGFYRTQYEEALLLFDSLIRYDQPIERIVDADWAYINRHQANIYRLQTSPLKALECAEPLPPINIHYRRADRNIARGNYEYQHAPLSLAKLRNPDRGGFVTLGPTLSVTSTANRTSPIRRGVWVMERILGEHFEQPADVPDLESTQKKAEKQRLNLSHAEILKLHSAQAGCAACHRYIDPVGFGLETFDQLGIRRSHTQPTAGGERLTWTPRETPRLYADRQWSLKQPLKPGSPVKVFFQYARGRHRLDIRNVRLTSGKHTLVDRHFGFTGNAQRNNVWFFSLPAGAPATGWQLTAEIRGNGGTDSHGTITVSGPDDASPGYRLPNGKTFRTPAEMKQLLLDGYREQIVENAIRRVLAYALGRALQPIDRPAVRKIREAIRKRNNSFPALLEAVVLSYPFRYKEFR